MAKSLRNLFDSLLQNPRRFASALVITALWIIVSFGATKLLWILPWTLVHPSLFHPLFELFPVFGVLIVIIAVLLGITLSLSRRFANVMLVLTPITSLLAALAAFLIFSTPCSGLGCLGHGLALFAEGLVVFLGIIVIPIAWARRKSDSPDFKVLLTKSLLPGLLSLLVFSGLWAVSTYPLRLLIQ